MKYRIMIAKSIKENFQTLYQYLTTNIDGEIKPLELDEEDDLNSYVEDMLNNQGYSKNDFVIINVKDYTIKTI